MGVLNATGYIKVIKRFQIKIHRCAVKPAGNAIGEHHAGSHHRFADAGAIRKPITISRDGSIQHFPADGTVRTCPDFPAQ